jgi:CRP-like cAMP-binding protein
MYESLMNLPYFQGMSKDEITSILDKVKLEFLRYNDGELILKQGEPCGCFTVLVRGEVTSSCISSDGIYNVIEELTTPFAFEPYSLFGLSPYYRCSYYAKGVCDVLSINKSYLFEEFARYDIFLMNMLNLVSQRVQQKTAQIWNMREMGIAEKIVNFMLYRTEQLDGCKILQVKMGDLATILGETRINVSRTLNAFQQGGVVELRRKEIIIPSLRKLKQFVLKEDKISEPI